MASLESSLKALVVKMTGKPIAEIPDSLEGIIQFAEKHFEAAASGQSNPGSPGKDGTDGVGVSAITLQIDAEGAVTSGKWTDTKGIDHDITIE